MQPSSRQTIIPPMYAVWITHPERSGSGSGVSCEDSSGEEEASSEAAEESSGSPDDLPSAEDSPGLLDPAEAALLLSVPETAGAEEAACDEAAACELAVWEETEGCELAAAWRVTVMLYCFVAPLGAVTFTIT